MKIEFRAKLETRSTPASSFTFALHGYSSKAFPDNITRNVTQMWLMKREILAFASFSIKHTRNHREKKTKRKEEDETSERVIPLKLERRRREGDGLLIELATPSLRPGLANWHFLFLVSKYRITSGSSVHTIRPIQLRLSSRFPFHARFACAEHFCEHSSASAPPTLLVPAPPRVLFLSPFSQHLVHLRELQVAETSDFSSLFLGLFFSVSASVSLSSNVTVVTSVWASDVSDVNGRSIVKR